MARPKAKTPAQVADERRSVRVRDVMDSRADGVAEGFARALAVVDAHGPAPIRRAIAREAVRALGERAVEALRVRGFDAKGDGL